MLIPEKLNKIVKNRIFGLFTAIVAVILACQMRGFCNVDSFSSMRPSLWRSSRTASADSFVLIATGSIHLHAVVVSNPGAASTFVTLYNSTSANAFSVNATSAEVIDTSSYKEPEYDEWFSSGVVYNKVGVADVNILWDFVLPVDPNSKNPAIPKWAP